MIVLAIDPGPEQSAWIIRNDRPELAGIPLQFAKDDNDVLLYKLKNWETTRATLVVEMIASYGMPVGREVFETCVWIGRFIQAWSGQHAFVYRRDVKLHLCGQARAKDGNVRQALIDRFGPGKERAIGKKTSPGPLYGITGDVWQALACAVTYSDKQGGNSAVERNECAFDVKPQALGAP